MAKKSLLSSTSKKKAKAKKKDAEKKTTTSKKSGAAKSVKKDAGAKAASKKKTATKSTKATKPVKSAAKAPKKATPKTATKQKKPVSIKELLLKKFDTIPPETLYSAPVDTTKSGITSPPFISESAPEEIERIRKLLFKQFDLNTPDPKEEAPAEKPVEEPAPEPEAKEEAPAEEPAEEPAPEPEVKKEAPREKISVYEIPKEKALPFSEITSASTSQPAEPPENESDAHDQGVDNMQKPIVIAGACLAAVLILLIGVSFSNMGNFEIKDNKGTIEIWKGKFAPLGAQKMIALEGMTVTEELLGASSKTDAYTLIYKNYIQKSDALLEKSGMPDYEAIRSYLSEAKSYAITPELKSLVTTRLHKIEMMTLLYKADISASKNTLPGLEAAKKYLTEATLLMLESSEESLVNQKLQWVESQIEGMTTNRAKETPPAPAPPVEKAPKADH